MKKQINQVESLPEETIPTIPVELTSQQITTLRVSLISMIGELQAVTEKMADDEQFKAYRLTRIDTLRNITKILWDARAKLKETGQ